MGTRLEEIKAKNQEHSELNSGIIKRGQEIKSGLDKVRSEMSDISNGIGKQRKDLDKMEGSLSAAKDKLVATEPELEKESALEKLNSAGKANDDIEKVLPEDEKSKFEILEEQEREALEKNKSLNDKASDQDLNSDSDEMLNVIEEVVKNQDPKLKEEYKVVWEVEEKKTSKPWVAQIRERNKARYMEPKKQDSRSWIQKYLGQGK